MILPASGLDYSTDDADAIAAVESFSWRISRLENGLEAILDTAKQHPKAASVQLSAAAFYLFGQTHATQAEAGKHLDRVAAQQGSLNEREAALLDALRLWHQDRYYAATLLMEVYTSTWPTDYFAHKALEFLYYTLGQQHSGERFRRHFQRLQAEHPPLANEAGFLSMSAFAHELSGLLDDAQAIAEKSLALEANNPWAHHCLSHVYIQRGNREAALATMQAYLPIWQSGNRMIYCHNAWHLALVHLDLLDYQSAMDVYRDHVWGVMPDTPGEEVDAIALLWRLEMAGGEVDEETWSDVADHVEARVDECFMPFLNAHFVYALARAGRQEPLETMLANVAARSAQDDDEARHIWAPVGQAVIEACAAYGAGNYGFTAEKLEPIIGWDVTAVGGSDAQDDLFRQAYFHALRQTGRQADARSYFDLMTKDKVLSELDMHWMGRS